MTSKQEPDASDAKVKEKSGCHRWLKIGLWVLAGFVALVLLVVILVPVILSEARLKSMVADAGAEALNGRQVSVGSVDLEYFSGVRLTDVRVGTREGFGGDFVRVKEVDVRVKVWSAVLSFGKELHATVSVVDPEILVERNADGEISVEDLLEAKAKETKKDEAGDGEGELLELDGLSLSLKVVGGRAVLRDKFGGIDRETTLKDLSVEAGIAAIDEPFIYKATGTIGDGRFEVSGEPRLFHNGVADPAQIRGELVKATISNLPADVVAAFLDLPPMVKSVDGELRVAADQPGQVTTTGKLTATSPHEGLGFGASLSSTADIQKRDASARITFNATPFSQGSFTLEVRDGGAKQMQAVGTFDLDLAKLTGSKAAKSLGLPTTADGAPATSQGRLTGRLEITGPLPQITCVVTGSIKGFQAHPSLTGGKALPAEDGDFRTKAILHLTADNKPDRLDIPLLEAKSSFLDAKVSNGRLASLADLKKLDADLAGHVQFSGRAFSSRFGKALGLPALSDKLAVTFSVKGANGRANIAANAKIEREQGTPEPVEFTFSAQLDAAGEKVALRDIKALAKAAAAAPYAHGTLTGTLGDLHGTPSANLVFAGSTDLRGLVNRFALYAKALADLKPSGQIEFSGAVDTGAGRAELRTLKVATPYLALGLKAPGVITGVDIAKFGEDPVAASKLLAGEVAMEGTVLLDRLGELPGDVVPAELKAGGTVPFSLKIGKASPMRIELAADATDAAIAYGDLIAKPKGSAAKLALVAVLRDGVAVDIPTLEAALGGAQMKLVGSVSEDLKTFTCKSLTAAVDDPAKLIAMVPKLKDVKLTGRSDLSLSGKIPIEQVAAGDLSGIEFTGTADLLEMHAGYAPMPKLAVTARGSVKLGAQAIDAGGLTVIATTLPDERTTTLTFKELRVTSAKKDAALLADPEALAVRFFAESPEIRASDLLNALPQDEKADTEKEAPVPSEKPEPGKEDDGGFAFLKKHEVTGRLAVAKVIYDKHVVSNVATEFQLRGNRLTMQKPLTAAVHQGTVEADVTADLNDPLIAHSGKVRVRKIDIDSAVSTMLPYKAVFEGKTGAELTWKGRGYSLDDIRRQWTGGGDVLIEDGVVGNFEQSPRWVASVAGFLTQHLGGGAFPGDKYTYGELKLKLNLADGKVTSEDFVVGGKSGLNFKVSDAWGDLAGNARASATVVAPTELAMNYLSKKFKLAKRPSVEAMVREKLTKLNPSFCSINIARQDAKYQIAPSLTITSWAGDALKSVLTDPGSLLKGILQDRLDKKREEEDAPGAEGDELNNGDKGEEEIKGVEQSDGPKTEEEIKREKKRKKKAEKEKKKREREDAFRKALEGLLQ